MPALAAQPNVAVKLSGMVRPFVGQVVEWFGVQRLMFGSDWPVCLPAGTRYECGARLSAI
jgi:L-fucono-1,5-lactonase